jgi:hypothetical protein
VFQLLIDGNLRYSPEPIDPPAEGRALICCATLKQTSSSIPSKCRGSRESSPEFCPWFSPPLPGKKYPLRVQIRSRPKVHL